MKPTRKAYIHRLRQMIAKADREGIGLCFMCPKVVGFDCRGSIVVVVPGYATLCFVCRNVMQVEGFKCPCDSLGPEEAERRARAVMKED